MTCASGYEKEISKIINEIPGEEKKYYILYDSELYIDVLYVNKMDRMLNENDLLRAYKTYKYNKRIKLLCYFYVYDS